MTDEDREQLQDPDADNDGDSLPQGEPITEDDRATPFYDEATGRFRAEPLDPEIDALIAKGEDLPDDTTEFASPPPDDDEPDPECRVTPDEPS